MTRTTVTGLVMAALLGSGLAMAAEAQSSSSSQAAPSGQAAAPAGAGPQASEPAAAASQPGLAAAAPGPEELAAGFQTWLSGFRDRALAAGLSAETLDRALSGLSYDPAIIARDRNQSEHSRQIWDYLERAVSVDRIANGKAALARHRSLFVAIADKYQVEAEVVAAIWGLETAYGTYRGDLPVISSLATLAYDARRGAYFERELIEALKILQAGHVDPGAFKGSWAGASGHTQFMPSSFWRSAVDWDGDGRRNLWSEDPADALASAAAYLAKNGWTRGLPWGTEVSLPAGFPWDQTGERIRKTLADWRALGVSAPGGGPAAPGVAGEVPASVLLPAGHEGAAFLIFSNFQVIETYNTADAYVIAIGSLSDQLAGRGPIRGDWPRGDRALSGAEKRELQQLLLDLGHDPKGVDGIMGPNTIEAIRGYQRQSGLIPDGYASLRLMEKLRLSLAEAAASGAVTGPEAGPEAGTAPGAEAGPGAGAAEGSAPGTGQDPATGSASGPAVQTPEGTAPGAGTGAGGTEGQAPGSGAAGAGPADAAPPAERAAPAPAGSGTAAPAPGLRPPGQTVRP